MVTLDFNAIIKADVLIEDLKNGLEALNDLNKELFPKVEPKG